MFDGQVEMNESDSDCVVHVETNFLFRLTAANFADPTSCVRNSVGQSPKPKLWRRFSKDHLPRRRKEERKREG